MRMQDATSYLLRKLRTFYPEGEARQMTDRVMESLTGAGKAERMLYKNSVITRNEELQLQKFTERLVKHEPVQYILQEAWFCGLKFYVDKNVLIPRPETEELVEWVHTEIKNQKSKVKNEVHNISILDIGTGSGCIPIALKRKLPETEIWSCDISEDALKVASRNAAGLDADINFMQLDFLDEMKRKLLPSFDIIISNPPYVPERDKEQMLPNVVKHEPPIALFVPDNDALIFYKAIAEFGKSHLNENGLIYAEIHESTGDDILQLFESKGYTMELKKDMQGKERMLKAEF